MADSKTEKATPKRRQDERKKGNAFKSTDVINAFSLLGVFFTLKLLLPSIYETLNEYILRFIGYLSNVNEISESFLRDITIGFIIACAKITIPLLLISCLIAIVSTMAQTKMLVSFETLKPKFSRINPLEGIKRMFSLRSVIELIKGIIKITILFYIIYNFLVNSINDFTKTLSIDLLSSCILVLNSTLQMVINVSIAFIAIAAFDYLYQWWDYERQIKMSKQEIKEEYKQMEGDPQIKGKIKEMQRKIATSRMMQAVPQADVVIRNPTHFAVALKYDTQKDLAPVVLAKGQDELALRIVKVAEENNICVIEDKPLTRAIYASTELNQMIPPEFYAAVAEVLVYVYRLNNKKL